MARSRLWGSRANSRRGASAAVVLLATVGGGRVFVSCCRPQLGTTTRGLALRATEEEQDAQGFLQEAKRLRGEAEAEAALLEARKRLRETKEKAEQKEAQEAEAALDPVEEMKRVEKQLEEAQAKLRKAEAFKLPERVELKKEVTDLEAQAASLQKRLAPPAPAPAPAPVVPPLPEASQLTRNGKPMSAWSDTDWEELATAAQEMSVEKRFELAQALGRDGRKRLSDVNRKRDEERQIKQKEEQAASEEEARSKAKDLKSKLSFDSLKEMSNEERIETAQAAGPAYLVSLGLVAVCYWALNLPFLTFAYHESTGEWPNLGMIDKLDSLAAAGTFAGVFAVYALLKPVRLFAALLLTPWTVENVMPKLPRFPGGDQQ